MTPVEIKALRKSLNMTQGELAKVMGVHAGTVSRWERPTSQGGVPPSQMAQNFMQMLARVKNILSPIE